MLKIYQTADMQKAFPTLVEKIYLQNNRIHIFAHTPEEALWIDRVLWTYKSLSFLPHGCQEADLTPIDHPIWISYGFENKNKAQVFLSAQFIDNTVEFNEAYQQILYFARLDQTDLIEGQRKKISQWWIQEEKTGWKKRPF